MNGTQRFNVLGAQISETDAPGALALVRRRIEAGGGGYVCFTNVHAVVTTTSDAAFREVTNGSFLSVADGKPVFWLARLRGSQGVGHVPGPDFMLRALDECRDAGHYFYGSSPQTLERLVDNLKQRFPGLDVRGSFSPPFRPLSDAERAQHLAAIRESGARFVWVGLGAPKQELWMAGAAPQVAPAVLFGVGAAFDFHAGVAPRAPGWMRHAGLEWLFRLASEPRRLWKRYLVTNSLFVWYAVTAWLGLGDRGRR